MLTPSNNVTSVVSINKKSCVFTITLKVICAFHAIGIRDDIQINYSCLFILYQGCGERCSYILRDRGKRTRLFTSKNNSVSNIDSCRQCLVRFKAVYQTQVIG